MSIAVPVAAAPPRDRRRLVLATVVAAQFIFVVDAFIVNVAIPSMRMSLGATAGDKALATDLVKTAA
jgi:hypothetical protein